MIRKTILLSAAFSFAALPASAQGWYPGFTGTGQVAQQASYIGPDDTLPNTATPAEFWGLRAHNAAAAAALVNAARVCGDGGTGDAATTVCATLPVKANGDLDLTNVTGGTVTTNPCFGGNGKCLVAGLYGQVGGVNAGSITTLPSGDTTVFYSQCPTGATTKPCFGSLTGTTSPMGATIVLNQPVIMAAVVDRVTATAAYVMGHADAGLEMGYNTAAGSLFVGSNGTINSTSYGSSIENRFNTINNLVNGASSCLQVNSASACDTAAASQGSGKITALSIMTLSASSGSFALKGYGTEFELISGTWTPAQELTFRANQASYWNVAN